MANSKGFFFVLEGTDGSGKGTQFNLLVEKLLEEGYEVETFDFPQYDKESSYFVREYLNGNYGSSEEVGPYTASLFYALDRYEAASSLRNALSAGKIVIANRFTGSNMAHQGTKLKSTEERKGYFLWLDAIEFQMLNIPRPDISLVLRVPADIAQGLVDKKEERQYTKRKRDLHEEDLEHLKKSVEVYDNLCELFPKDFKQLDCVRGKKLMEIRDIHNLIWETIKPMLPSKPGKNKKKETKQEKTDNPYLSNKDHGLEINEKGYEKLDSIVTNSKSNVYSFTKNISPQTIAAAMARLSRRGDDMRITLLDEFMGEADKDEKLLRRVITAYGDDSVQQLVGQHVVVEGASNLLTKKLEWGRLASYLEQSTRYIYFDQKNSDGKYKYYVPEQLDKETKEKYVEIQDEIFNLYSEMVHKLTDFVRTKSSTPEEERDGPWKGATRAQACDAVRPVLPVATMATVGIFASAQAMESLIMHLHSETLPEAQETGTKLLNEVRKVAPVFYERADKPDRGGAFVAYRANTSKEVKTLAQQELRDTYSATSLSEVQLASVWPKNELDIVPDMLYEHTELPLSKIQDEVSSWPYDRKRKVFDAYMGERLNRRHRPGRAMEKIHYSWDLICDYGIFRDLQRHRMVDDLQWQQLTPRYGYDTPDLIEDAGLTELYERCFELSLKLYSIMQASGYEEEAQYATLLGHKMRWKITFNSREAFQLLELRSSPQGHPGYRRVALQMHALISEVHPLIGEAMKFVNKGEDPELTRLAAERYTQFKLDQLKD